VSRGRKPSIPLSNEGKLKITTIEVAVFQLETAIGLWFSDGDSASIITLVHAAHEIISKLNKGHSNKTVSMNDIAKEYLNENFLQEWPKVFNLDFNFCKHGGSNPNEIGYLTTASIPHIIADATRMFACLGFETRSYFHGFVSYMWFTNPQWFVMQPQEIAANEIKIKEMNRIIGGVGKEQFFQTYLKVFCSAFAPKWSPVVLAKSPPVAPSG
jgi:hypothetical protein